MAGEWPAWKAGAMTQGLQASGNIVKEMLMTRARGGVSATVTRRLALVWALAALVVVAWPAQAQDAYEPDEDIDLAAPIELGELQSHTYHEDDATDLVVIEVKAGTIYTVQTLNLSAGVDTVVATGSYSNCR